MVQMVDGAMPGGGRGSREEHKEITSGLSTPSSHSPFALKDLRGVSMSPPPHPVAPGRNESFSTPFDANLEAPLFRRTAVDQMLCSAPRVIFWGAVLSSIINVHLIVSLPNWARPLFNAGYNEFLGLAASLLTAAGSGFAAWISSSFLGARIERYQRIRKGQCEDCGYQRIGWQDDFKCPECGSDQDVLTQLTTEYKNKETYHD